LQISRFILKIIITAFSKGTGDVHHKYMKCMFGIKKRKNLQLLSIFINLYIRNFIEINDIFLIFY